MSPARAASQPACGGLGRALVLEPLHNETMVWTPTPCGDEPPDAGPPQDAGPSSDAGTPPEPEPEEPGEE